MKKKLFISLFLFAFSTAIFAQATFDLGLKAGLNTSKVTFDRDGYNSESIVKYHVGAFGRLGFNRIFVQPEAYFSAKGGEMDGSALDVATRFDYSTVDVPLLLGIKIIDGDRANFRIMAGPVFGFFTSSEIDNEEIFEPQYYKDSYIAFQYGIGADLYGFTLDLRMENTASDIYQQPSSDLDGNNKTFMISVGYKIF
ncbi:MAG TPA: porin family protein [Tangfeifania sp.]|nr:porin family protein [Tangfeifania sp.]